jgi:NTP pyrophosphatase (non-canonical NTP hydrolase)
MNLLEVHLKSVVDPTWNYAERCKTWDDHVWNAVSGLAGEAGEVLDEHKKLFFHKEKDRTENITNEIGDLCYYLSKLLQLHGLTLEECLEANKVKLFARYNIKP